ncbi:MAG: hypothetical protein IPM45_04325 [Acidimicrobiales bacterium]|nr:hypothetical protein [Acidimicrobiales bacterium]
MAAPQTIPAGGSSLPFPVSGIGAGSFDLEITDLTGGTPGDTLATGTVEDEDDCD